MLGITVAASCLYLTHKTLIENPNGSPDGAAMVQVTVPQLNVVEERGEAAFNQNCASCHGKDAVGRQGVAPPLVHRIYEPSHHGDMSFVLAAKQGVRQHHWSFGNMPPVPDLTDNHIDDIIAYVRRAMPESW